MTSKQQTADWFGTYLSIGPEWSPCYPWPSLWNTLKLVFESFFVFSSFSGAFGIRCLADIMLRRPAFSTSVSLLCRGRGLSFYPAFDHAADTEENKTGFATGQVIYTAVKQTVVASYHSEYSYVVLYDGMLLVVTCTRYLSSSSHNTTAVLQTQ